MWICMSLVCTSHCHFVMYTYWIQYILLHLFFHQCNQTSSLCIFHSHMQIYSLFDSIFVLLCIIVTLPVYQECCYLIAAYSTWVRYSYTWMQWALSHPKLWEVHCACCLETSHPIIQVLIMLYCYRIVPEPCLLSREIILWYTHTFWTSTNDKLISLPMILCL